MKPPLPHPRVMLAAAAVLAAFVALLAWGVSSAPGSSPDDDYHLASIWCAVGNEDGICEAGSHRDERLLPADVIEAASCFAFDAAKSASCPLDEERMAPTARGNWNGGGYPPLFYATMRLFVTDDLSQSVLAMRSFNAFLYVGLLTALFVALPRSHRIPLLWGAVLTAVPLSIFLIPSVNPSSWAVLSASGVWIAAWGFLESSGLRRVALAVLTALLVLIGAGARSDSAVYAILSLIAAGVLAFAPRRRYALALMVPVALAVVATVFFLNAGQSAVVGSSTVVENGELSFSTLAFVNAKQLPQLLAGVFGVWGLGWLDTYMPGVVWVPAMSVFAAVVFWGLRRGDWRKWLALAGIGASTIVVPMYILLHDGVVVGNGVQPRYILPLIIVFAGVSVVGFATGGLGLGKLQMTIVAVGLVVANSVALHVNVRRYVTGVDLQGMNLDRDVEWWWNAPISPMGIWVLGSLAFGLAVSALLYLAFTSRANRVEQQRAPMPAPA